MLDINKAAKAAIKRRRKSKKGLLKKGLKKTIKKRTEAQYSSKLKVLRRFLKKAFGSPKFTKERFIRFCDAAKVTDPTWSSYSSYRYALRNYQITNCLRRWADDEDLVDYCEGMEYERGDRKKVKKERGAITRKMMEALVSYVEKKQFQKKKETLRRALVILLQTGWLCSLRVSQVVRILVGDWVEDEEESFAIWLRKDKRCSRKGRKRKARDKDQELHEKPIPKAAFLLLKAHAEELKLKHGSFLFPKLMNEKFVREIVQEAAVKLKWPKEVDWSGPHCLRHGGTALMKKEALKFVEGWMSQASDSMVKHYSRSNRTRAQARKATKKNENKKGQKGAKKSK